MTTKQPELSATIEPYTTLIDRLTKEFGEGWTRDTDTLHCSGESADDIPEWTIVDGKYGYWVTFELGSYQQQGEAQNADDLVALMHGMEEACKALNEYWRKLWKSSKG